jgi:cytochrome c-type biogenesis protein CcmH/NrfF
MKLLFVLVLSLSSGTAFADPAEREAALEQARQFLLLAPDAQKNYSQKLSAREAEALKSQVIALRRARNPDITALDYVITQLATISALEVAQNRLNSLLWAISLTFLLLIAFLAFVMFEQRRLAAALLARETSKEPAPRQQLASRTSPKTKKKSGRP